MNQLIVNTNNLNFSYNKSEQDIENLELKVPKGSIYGFLGPNGSGKSTTIRLLLGLLKKTSGTVVLFGETFNNKTRLKILDQVGALIENPSLYEHLDAVDNLRIAANYRQNISFTRIHEVLEIVKLTHAKNKKIKEYSLGMKQRLGLAMSLLSNPELIILDEPTNGLDPKGIIEMRTLIKDLNETYGTTIFISSHLLSEIERTCTHVGIIRNGKMIYQDTVASLKVSKGSNIKLDIEVDLPNEALSVLKDLNMGNVALLDDFLQIEVCSKEDITKVIDVLRASKINIYQVTIKNNLEELFLSLTEN
ncbi:ABC transporter ATP-binding protein [Winogradskyella thalassocola]|uniref:ABC-2 type transport system ATP-binding protein n=1 Tax=Winogradskyella thalassocola TaxID=262004 RepID=A0A1G8FHT6_9FLAO|nr:ATP-binding cassette domain-containing protein [Winogradskyella thalassocola]SDH81693.1 ABC-2 type transport system ATP-binding protein [Winogradskyella thalassocola]